MVPTSKRSSRTATTLAVFTALAVALVLIMGGRKSESKATGSQTKLRIETKLKSNTRQLLSTDENQQQVIDVSPREIIDPHLIDFVVGGFPKCGTTYLQNKILIPSKRLFMPHSETHFLANNKYDEFKNEFANVTQLAEQSSKPLLSGYKSPFELGHRKSLQNLETLFPDVRMIITLRHPVLQFESLYNYKLRKLPDLIPPAEEFMGLCREACPSSSSVVPSGGMETMVAQKSSKQCLHDVTFCTGGSNYHHYLSRLGLTPMDTPEELDLLDHHDMSIHHFPGWQKESTTTASGSNGRDSSNPQPLVRGPGWNKEGYHGNESSREGSSEGIDNGRLFLIEIEQLDNRANQSIADDLVSDLEGFLGLDTGDLPRAPHREGEQKPKTVYTYPPGREEHVLDICLDRYAHLRLSLMENSRKASKWIREYLLHPSNRDTVVVSNIDSFERMVDGWNIDPCSIDDDINLG